MNTLVTLWLLIGAMEPSIVTQYHTVSNNWKLASPTLMVGKRITSSVSLKRSATPNSTAASSGPSGSTMMVTGPAEQTITRELTIKPGATPNSLTFEQVVKRVYITLESPLGKSIYDSDNTFERDQITSGIGQRYDPYINKLSKIEYPVQKSQAGKATSTEGFENVWGLNLPVLIEVQALQGIFIPRLPDAAAVGMNWVDTVRLSNGTTVNKYSVMAIRGDVMKLKLTSELQPGSQAQHVRSRNGNAPATSTTTLLAYTGEIDVRQSSGFIEKLQFSKNSSATLNAAGQTIQSTSTGTVELKNSYN